MKIPEEGGIVEKYERLLKKSSTGIRQFEEALSPRDLEEPTQTNETSPLLKVLRSSRQQDGTFSSLPVMSVNEHLQGNAFRPIIYAEKSLGSLLHGVVSYILCCVIGLGLIALKFEEVMVGHLSWWIVFIPFWIGNLVLFWCHISSIRHTRNLQRWAEADSMTNEPLLPVLRQILPIYAISIPLMLLLLWSEVAFCARLENRSSTNLYICYTPLLLIETFFVIRYSLCRARSNFPVICWVLVLLFTGFLAYQTSITLVEINSNNEVVSAHEPLSWWFVLSPLFAFDMVMIICLGIILYNQCRGVYILERWQFIVLGLYGFALLGTSFGQAMLLLPDSILHNSRVYRTIPSILIFAGLVCAALGIYVVCRHYVTKLMASKGGAVPQRLRKTSIGWVSSGSESDRWMLLGDIYVHRVEDRDRTFSDVETDIKDFRDTSLCCCLCCGKANNDISEPKKYQSKMSRTSSGSYHDLTAALESGE